MPQVGLFYSMSVCAWVASMALVNLPFVLSPCLIYYSSRIPDQLTWMLDSLTCSRALVRVSRTRVRKECNRIVKQMKTIHQNGLKEHELAEYLTDRVQERLGVGAAGCDLHEEK